MGTAQESKVKMDIKCGLKAIGEQQQTKQNQHWHGYRGKEGGDDTESKALWIHLTL